MLNVAIKAARAAGAIINRAALDVETVRVSAKQTNDFVTEVDKADFEANVIAKAKFEDFGYDKADWEAIRAIK